MRIVPTLVLVFLGLFAPRAADAAIVACEHAHFEGRCERFEYGIVNLQELGFNDAISSLRIRRGPWLICVDADFGGRCEVFAGSVENLSGTPFQDSISSLRPLRGSGAGSERDRDAAILVFVHADLRGRSAVFTSDVSNLKEFGLNDAISSLRVLGGRWEVCADSRFRNCVEVGGEIGNLREIGLNDAISSIRALPDRPPRGRERARGRRY